MNLKRKAGKENGYMDTFFFSSLFIPFALPGESKVSTVNNQNVYILNPVLCVHLPLTHLCLNKLDILNDKTIEKKMNTIL